MNLQFSHESCLEILDFVKKIIDNTGNIADVTDHERTETNDCPTQDSIHYALKLIEFLGLPQEVFNEVHIEEIPLCWDDQVAIYFSLDDKDQFAVTTGITTNKTTKERCFFFELAIVKAPFTNFLCTLLSTEISLYELKLIELA